MSLKRTRIGRNYRNILRYKQIITILIKHGFHDFVEHSHLLQKFDLKNKFFDTGKYKPKAGKITNHHWQRIRLVLEDLGPTFIKLGQFLSNRPDIVPSELCNELEKLLDNVPPFSGKMAIIILEKELNTSTHNIFKHFSKNPFSAASISQVHEARLKDGKKVAVKIQRPAIRNIIESDIEIMYHIAHLIKKHVEGADIIDPFEIVDEFKDGIFHELDFENEAINIDKFRAQFKENKNIKLLSVYKEYSTKKVLCMKFMEGTTFTELDVKDKKIDFTEITDNLADLVLAQIFEKGYFHADPHSGNLLVCKSNKIGFIDFGLMGLLPPKHKTSLCEMIFGLVEHDPDRITRALIKVSTNKEVENRNILEDQVFKIIEKYTYLPLEDINVGHFLRDLLNTIVANKLKIPSDIYLLLKAIIALEGTVRRLKPKFDMISHLEPFVRKLLHENTGVVAFFKSIYSAGFDYTRLFCELPAELRELFDQIKNKTMKIQFEHRGMEPLLEKGDQIVNRLAFSIITASMMIGSALIIHAGIPPRVAGISLIGIITFLFSVSMGGLLLLYIIKHGKM